MRWFYVKIIINNSAEKEALKMKFLTDKLIIFILCTAPFLFDGITALIITGVLFAITAACICQTAEQNKPLKTILEAAYGIIAIFIPEFAFFAPLPLYEAARTKDKQAIAVLGLSIAKSFIFYHEDFILCFLLCVLAVYLSFDSNIINNQQQKLIESRDNSVEHERLLRQHNRELKANMEYELKINTLNERNRIAREIHDNVGHILSRALLQTGALCAICPKEQTAIRNGLETLKENLDIAMESIRKSVHGIREESLDIRLELEKIDSELRGRFQTDIHYDMEGELPPKLKPDITAILKEAVSNILRHSNGNKVQIILREHPALYQLIVFDNGDGKIQNGGMGIEDMRQRTEELGGIFRVSTDKGFTVFASFKKEI